MTVICFLLTWSAFLTGASAEGAALQPTYRLSLSTAEGPFYERTPVPFHVDVTNITDEPLRVGLILKPIFNRWVHVLYRRVPDEFRTLDYTSEWDEPGRHPDFEMFALKGRESASFALSLAADPARGTFIFDRPGEYELKVRSDVRRDGSSTPHVLETPPLRIRVEPAPPSEGPAIEDWDVDLAIFAQNDGGYGTSPRFRRSVLRSLKFMDAHPNSPYAQALRAKTLETLHALVREGVPLTAYEQEGFERLKRTLREAP